MLKPLDFEIFLKSPIGQSKNFTWAEALYLPRWEMHTLPTSPNVFLAIEKTAMKMQAIRDFLNKQIRVTNWFRPTKYNDFIGGAKGSSHIRGLACDFQVLGLDADTARGLVLPKLAEFEIRMENLPKSNWVHIDLNCDEKTSLDKRFFKP